MFFLIPFVMTVQLFLHSSNMFPKYPPRPYLSVFLSLWSDLALLLFTTQHNNKSTTHFIQSKNHSTNLLTFFRKMHSKGSQRGFKFYTYPLLAVHCQKIKILFCPVDWIYLLLLCGRWIHYPSGLILRVWTCVYWHISISNSASIYAHTDCDKIWIRCQANSFVLWDMTYIMDFI
jgi:hypothetical protein